jgi:hypothetical protein
MAAQVMIKVGTVFSGGPNGGGSTNNNSNSPNPNPYPNSNPNTITATTNSTTTTFTTATNTTATTYTYMLILILTRCVCRCRSVYHGGSVDAKGGHCFSPLLSNITLSFGYRCIRSSNTLNPNPWLIFPLSFFVSAQIKE